MITYFATPRSRNEIDILAEEGAAHLLIPYSDSSFELFYKYALSKGLKILVDSGAYTAFTQGKKIDIVEFGAKMLELSPKKFINLDVIGDAVETTQNQKYLESLGLNPIPVWHHGSAYESLNELVKKYDLIAIGGLVTTGISSKKRNEILKTIIQMFPLTKFHGLGVGTAVDGLYSGDSTAWIAGARYGRLITKKGSVNLSGSYFTKHELLRHNIRGILRYGQPDEFQTGT